ncbi:MAG TPA: M20/M25/M40 family metallo-hydrolase [Solirubrobacteraceae bacterium]|nr:M20/M25/M40 family metallo-hydrolase [Solirubrobacteraceae bacterium]
MDERERLHELFCELCRLDSPSGREQVCAERVRAELADLGLSVSEDDAAAQIGAGCGNLLARAPGPPGTPRVLLCAHMDTVPAAAPIEPELVEGFYANANEAILGADNKAAIAVILAVLRRSAERGAPVALELLFTVGEERALAGARAFDVHQLQSPTGYVFDHATPIGEIITAAPSSYSLSASFRGAAAHAGICPEAGRSAIVAAAHAVAAMQLGRLDEQSTANIGVLEGGSAVNVVPERCTLRGEARSLDDARAGEVVAAMVDHIHDAANRPDCECDVDVTVERLYGAYRVPGTSEALRVAERALERHAIAPRRIATGGGSDAAVLRAGGVDCVNLANGTEAAHEPTERVSAAALDTMLEVVWSLLQETAAA